MAILEDILQQQSVWRGAAFSRPAAVVATGYAALDRELPGGGWPSGALTEILGGLQGNRRAADPAAGARRAVHGGQARGLAGAAAPALCAGARRRGRRSGEPCRGARAGPARRAVGGGAGAARGKLPRAAGVAAAGQLSRAAAAGDAPPRRAASSSRCSARAKPSASLRPPACASRSSPLPGSSRCASSSAAARPPARRCALPLKRPAHALGRAPFPAPAAPRASSASRPGPASSPLRSRSSRRASC